MKAMQIKTQIAVGESPIEEKAIHKNSFTFGKMFEEYMERYSKKEKRTWREDAREIKQYLGHWITKEVSEITKEDLIVLHQTRCRSSIYFKVVFKIKILDNLHSF